MKTLQLTCSCLESESRCPGGFAWSLVMLEFACFCSEPMALGFLLGPSGMALTDNKPHNWSHLFFLTLQEPSQPSKHSPKAHTSPNPQREASPPSRKAHLLSSSSLVPFAAFCLQHPASLWLLVLPSLWAACTLEAFVCFPLCIFLMHKHFCGQAAQRCSGSRWYGQ